jgi:hypothetical protein
MNPFFVATQYPVLSFISASNKGKIKTVLVVNRGKYRLANNFRQIAVIVQS